MALLGMWRIFQKRGDTMTEEKNKAIIELTTVDMKKSAEILRLKSALAEKEKEYDGCIEHCADLSQENKDLRSQIEELKKTEELNETQSLAVAKSIDAILEHNNKEWREKVRNLIWRLENTHYREQNQYVIDKLKKLLEEKEDESA